MNMEEYLKGSSESSMPGHTTQDLNHCLDGILGLLKALPTLVSSRSEQLANALHVMVRMLARLLRKIIHPQTI